MYGHNASGARLLGEFSRLWKSCHDILQTSVTKARVGAIRAGRRPDRHPEPLKLLVSLFTLSEVEELISYRLESRDLLIPVGVERLLQVVDGHSTLQVAQESIGVLGYTLVSPVAGLEVHDSRPVVGEVLGEAAGCARGLVSNIHAGVHGRVEGISTYDLVEMG